LIDPNQLHHFAAHLILHPGEAAAIPHASHFFASFAQHVSLPLTCPQPAQSATLPAASLGSAQQPGAPLWSPQP
jgi:hypothetical protein